MKRLTIIILLYFGGISLFAQEIAEDQLGNWLMYTGNTKLSENFSVQSIAQLRLYELNSNINQMVFLVGVNQKLSKNTKVGIGYGHIKTETFDKELLYNSKSENRIFEQFILKNAEGRVKFNHRYQLEHRWINNPDGKQLFLNRMRYRLLLTIPLNHKELLDHTFFINIYDEVHLNLTKTPFNQNWVYLALGYKINKTFSLQAGYQKQFVGGSMQFDRLQLGICFNMDTTN